ncbi:NAD(P)-binding domain-containing protein [Mycolicibacterium mucogenicum]|uniref:NADPH-dependent F420 reductase n=1 Tax=Mycolicibacterium mucogenicum TaxID=56689 RepID=UPI00226A8483|nr:NAD(P)-binding domain-containing protein [Mycolicibacterium mucogenicum]MCX8560068.1 NAD(P)-binding domain-containing protein [Mycolicibacterium mucogenicum]
MRIAIIGAGNVGSTLGRAWQRLGHEITYGVRQPGDTRHAGLGTAVTDNATAVADAEVVAVCTPWQGTQAAVTACGDLTGKVLIDCTNPLTPDVAALELGHTTSGAEQIAAWAPGARVCKTMNQIGAPMMDSPALPTAPVMFVCGDDNAAKDIAAQLVQELGFETLDAGDLTAARLLEPLALLWIHMALRRGLGTQWALGVLHIDS